MGLPEGILTKSEPDISVWAAENAPADLSQALPGPLPPGAWVMRISSTAAQNVLVEAWIRARSPTPLIARVQLEDGGLALLFASLEASAC
jgi:hypothetical protein